MLHLCTACACVLSGARPLARLLSACVLLVLTVVAPLDAQAARSALRVTVAEENFRAAPNGARLAMVHRDAQLTAGEGTDGKWREATLEAWLPARAVTSTTRDGFSLVVVSGGSPLYGEPSGAVVGRGFGGFLLHEVERRADWVRVRRSGWIWGPSAAPAPVAETRAATSPAPTSPQTPSATPAPADSATAARRTEPAARRVLRTAPAGDTLAVLTAAAGMEVVGREGDWARVRVEGWIPLPAGEALRQPDAARNVSLRALRSEPERFRGVTVHWQVQFVALQTADSLRTDLQPGERYLLARDPGGEPGLVYIAVPPEMLSQVRQLTPLQRVQVVGRVRTGRSSLMGHPVLELLELRR